MKQYITPEIEIFIFEHKDAIVASAADNDNGYSNINDIPLDTFFLS